MAHSKADRYPRQPQRPGPRMRVDGHDLGFAMLPNDLLIALRAATAMARAWTPAQRGLVTLATVDTATGLTAALRAVSLTRAWWTALADTLDACGPTTPAERDAAMARDYRRWPRTADMLGAAAAAEIAGL